jgi:hypothetical protein
LFDAAPPAVLRTSCVRMLRFILVAAALAAEVAGYVHERRRLAVVQRLSGPAGRDYLEATGRRGERFLWIVTALLAAGALSAGVWLALEGHARP